MVLNSTGVPSLPVTDAPETAPPDSLTPLVEVVVEYERLAKEELDRHLSEWPPNLAEQEVREVVSALLARQVSLATEFALSVQAWTPHLAPVLLRAMADVHVSLAWICKAPLERSRRFIHYGLGQVKLMIEHRKRRLAERGDASDSDPVIPVYESWVESQRWLFLTDVDLGSWSGITTRQMALEADCLDFYNHVYVPFSGAAHSTWHHVSIYNLRMCTNPLHRYHRIADVPDGVSDPYFAFLAAKYLNRSFTLFEKEMRISASKETAFDRLNKRFESLGRCQGLDAADADTERRCGESPKTP